MPDCDGQAIVTLQAVQGDALARYHLYTHSVRTPPFDEHEQLPVSLLAQIGVKEPLSLLAGALNCS